MGVPQRPSVSPKSSGSCVTPIGVATSNIPSTPIVEFKDRRITARPAASGRACIRPLPAFLNSLRFEKNLLTRSSMKSGVTNS